MQRESFSILMFLLEPVNVALGVTGELVRLGLTQFDSCGVIIGVVELLIPFVELVKRDYCCMEKMSHKLNCFFC